MRLHDALVPGSTPGGPPDCGVGWRCRTGAPGGASGPWLEASFGSCLQRAASTESYWFSPACRRRIVYATLGTRSRRPRALSASRTPTWQVGLTRRDASPSREELDRITVS